jgi:predicted metal-dependent hydrolase
VIDGLEVVRHPRARVARLSVDPVTGRVRLTVPRRMALKKAIEWAGSKAGWIEAQRLRLPQARPFVPSALVPVAGRMVRLHWDATLSRTVRLVEGASDLPAVSLPEIGGTSETDFPSQDTSPQRRPGFPETDISLRWGNDGRGVGEGTGSDAASAAATDQSVYPLLACGGPREGFEARIARWLAREALRLLTEETAHYAGKAGVTVARVAVGDPKARWGSCSSSGAIRYSWRLLLAPAVVRRSTVAHEVAHRVHMHHGPDFHALVADLFEGDPDEARQWLRRDGAALHWYGRAS